MTPPFLKVDFVNQITLDCLLNKEMYTDHVQNKKMAKVNKEERKFYKKRIFQLFKDSITGSEPEDLPMDIKYAYNNYLNACIQYFKTKDSNDVIQSEFKDFIFTEENTLIQDVSFNEINQSENNLEADKILIFTLTDQDKKTKTKLKTKTKSTFEKDVIKPKSDSTNLMCKKIDS